MIRVRACVSLQHVMAKNECEGHLFFFSSSFSVLSWKMKIVLFVHVRVFCLLLLCRQMFTSVFVYPVLSLLIGFLKNG